MIAKPPTIVSVDSCNISRRQPVFCYFSQQLRDACDCNANQNKHKEVAKVRKVTPIADLAPGMVLARCVVDFNGKVVLSEGCVITEKTIQRLDAWDIREVCIDCPESASNGS